MNKRWAHGFTIVELIITIVVIAILALIIVVGYSGATKLARSTAAKSDLTNLAASMERELQRNNAYPSTLPADFSASKGVTVSLVNTGSLPYYTSLSPVQSGVLFAAVCQRLIDNGVGKGTAQDGTPRDYITGCGNWNHDSMQVTGWQSKVWNTPVDKDPLLQYSQNFTANNAWDVDQERAVKLFYGQLISQYEQQGGHFPITSFWDYWATSSNGGVMQEPLDPNASSKPFFCAQATVDGYSDLLWHVSRGSNVEPGPCS